MTSLNYRIIGPSDGIPIVFLHAVCVSSWMWEKFLPQLPNVKALLIDLPGHGSSADIPWVSLEQTAQQVLSIVKDEFKGGGHLVGISLGSYVGLTLLAENPKMFHSAFLSGMHDGGMKKRGLMKIMSLFLAPLATTSFFARKNAASLGIEPDQIDGYVSAASQTKPMAFMRATNDVVDFEMPIGVTEIETKVKFVSGDREHALIKGATDKLAKTVPSGSSLFVPDGGHGWPSRKPDYFVEQVLQHISQ
ncbi:MAG: alpha/beta hydrolase [Lentilitoribacter sp.]